MLDLLAEMGAERFKEERAVYKPIYADHIIVEGRWVGDPPRGFTLAMGWKKVLDGKEYGSMVCMTGDFWKGVRLCEEHCRKTLVELAIALEEEQE